jgi:hypothetical protein
LIKVLGTLGKWGGKTAYLSAIETGQMLGNKFDKLPDNDKNAIYGRTAHRHMVCRTPSIVRCLDNC